MKGGTNTMKLAEALALRADAQKRLEQLTSRANAVARYQEGEPPAENPAELLAQARVVIDEIEGLVRRVNRTNAVTYLEPGLTVTDAIARRDALKLRAKLETAVADAAAGHERGYGYGRAMRSELRYVTDLPVTELRDLADRAARELRTLDTKIQQANWNTELVD
jgi:hypothetical protein